MTKREELEYALVHTISDKQESQIQDEWRAFYNSPMSFVEDRVVDMVCQDLGLPIPSERKDLIEEWLEIKLTYDQLVTLQQVYPDFYEDGELIATEKDINSIKEWFNNTYGDSKKEESDKADTYNEKHEKEKETMALIKYDNLEMKHESPDSTLQWGKIAGDFCYIRLFSMDEFDFDMTKLPMTDEKDTKNLLTGMSDENTVFVVYSGLRTNNVIVIGGSYGVLRKYSYGTSVMPGNYYLDGIIPIITDASKYPDITEYVRFLKHTYVSWYISGAGHHIPIMWQLNHNPAHEVTTDPDFKLPFKMSENSNDVVVTLDSCNTVVNNWEYKFPPVDLETQESQRYARVNMATGAEVYYNRNYKAYNGNVSAAVKVLPLLFEEWYADATQFYPDKQIYQDVLRIASEGTIEKSVILTTDSSMFDSDTTDIATAPSLPGISEQPKESKSNESYEAQVDIKANKKFEANILIRAAKASDTKN